MVHPRVNKGYKGAYQGGPFSKSLENCMGTGLNLFVFGGKNYICKISQRKIDVYRLHTSSEISWVIPSQLNQCIHGHHLRFCSKLHQMCPCGSNEKSPNFRSKFQAI